MVEYANFIYHSMYLHLLAPAVLALFKGDSEVTFSGMYRFSDPFLPPWQRRLCFW